MADIPIKQLKRNIVGGGGEAFYPPTSTDAVIRTSDNKILSGILTNISGNMSDAFSDSKSYAIGDYCIYQDELYKFLSAKTAGATTPLLHTIFFRR